MKIPNSLSIGRIVFYGIGLSCVPVFLAYVYVSSLISEASCLHEELVVLKESIAGKVLHQASNRAIMAKYRGSDPLYLHKKVEQIPMMQHEIEYLRHHLSTSSLPEDIPLERRLNTLLHNDAHCLFLETSSEVGPGYKQIIETQTKPVEMDNQDIEQVLQFIEDENSFPERPHLMISEASFDRKKNGAFDSWQVMLKILRREYTP